MDNAVRDDGGGISMVHQCGLKNLLMVKVRALEILKLRTTRNNPTKDRPTPPILASQKPTRVDSKELNQYIRHNWMKRPDDMTTGTGKM